MCILIAIIHAFNSAHLVKAAWKHALIMLKYIFSILYLNRVTLFEITVPLIGKKQKKIIIKIDPRSEKKYINKSTF